MGSTPTPSHYFGGNMQITWLLGNGFDLSFKLKTSFWDFYNYLKDNESSLNLNKNIIYSTLKEENKEKEDKEKIWRNYEEELGIITDRFKEEQIEQFWNDKLNLDDYLRDYLDKCTREKLNFSEEQKFEILSKSLQDIINDKKDVESQKVRSILQSHQTESFYVNSISFNYTDTVSKIFKKTSKSSEIKIDGKPNNSGTVQIQTPFYLHGTLDNDEMIIGLGHIDQIKNPIFKTSNNIQEALLKNKLLDIAGQDNFNKYVQMIRKSSIICLFGLSIGSTDQEYWRIIKEKLLKDDALLIIYWFDDRVGRLNILRRNVYENKIRDKFYISSNTLPEEKEIIKSKILVEINHNIFGNLISNNEEK